MKRKLLLKILALGLAFLLCACTGTAASASATAAQSGARAPVPPLPGELPLVGASDERLLCSLPHLNSQTTTELARGLQDRCDELGIPVVMNNAHEDHLAQASAVDAFVKEGGKAIVCRPVDAEAMEPFFALARQQGVFVVVLAEGQEAPPNNGQADAALWTNGYAAGQLLGQNAAAFAKQQQGATAVLLLDGARTPFAAGVEDAYTDALPEAQISTHIIPEAADLLAESLLRENPDICVFLAESDAAALSVRQGVLRVLAQAQSDETQDGLPALPQAEPDLSGMYFGGFGASLEGLEALQNGQLAASVSENGYAMGVEAANAAAALLQGDTPQVEAVWPVLVNRQSAAEYNNTIP